MAGNHVEAVVSQFVLNFSVSLTIFLLGNSVYSNARYSRRIAISVLTCITSMIPVGAPLLDLSALCFCRLRGVIWRQWRVSEPH